MKHTMKRVLALLIAMMFAVPSTVFAEAPVAVTIDDVIVVDDPSGAGADPVVEEVDEILLEDLDEWAPDAPPADGGEPQPPEAFGQSAAVGEARFTVTGEAGAFPAGSALRVGPVEDEALAQRALLGAEAVLGGEGPLTHHLYWIEVLDAEGSPCVPSGEAALPRVQVEGLDLADVVRVVVYDVGLDGSYETEAAADGQFSFADSAIYDIVEAGAADGEAPAEPTGGEESAEPTDGEAPAEPTGGEEPAAPADGEEPAEPTGGEEPAEPTGGEEPAEPTDGEEPAEPTDGEEPAEPADGEEPVEPADGEEPAEPADGEEPAEPADEAAPVAVVFNRIPETAAVAVWSAEEAVPAQADGSYALLPGEYAYSASADGYIGIERAAFTVAPGEGPLVIDVVLEAEAPEPVAFDQSKTVNGVIVTVRADPGVFPANAALSVKRVPVYRQRQADAAIDEVRDDDQNVAVSYTFDIKVIDPATNEELQPADGQSVSVSFALAEVADENLTTSVYHVTEDASTGALVAESLDVSTETTPATGEAATATVETDGFSLYTVEFTYDTLQYVLEGGESVPLAEITTAVGLQGEPTPVSVSDESLFCPAHEGGAWVIRSLRPFTTEEWMKVEIGGTTFTIIVTDSSGIDYYDPVNKTTLTCGDYTVLTDQTALSTGWYAVTEDATFSDRLTVTGDVNLILCDKATLTAKLGVVVEGSNKLTVWAQSAGGDMGVLYAGTTDGAVSTGSFYDAGLGSRDGNAAGTIILNGGHILAVGGFGGAGIGTGWGGNGGNITINGGIVDALSGGNAAGIGAGCGSGGKIESITINGKNTKVNAVSDPGGLFDRFQYGAGIGSGANAGVGTIKITGGSIVASGSNGAPGIGGGGTDSSALTVDLIEITGGEILSTGNNVKSGGGEDAPGIGGGFRVNVDKVVIGGTATVTAVAGHVQEGGKAAAIGTGNRGTLGELTIYDLATVSAGTDADEAETVSAWPDGRVDACLTEPYAKIEPCRHPDGSEVTIKRETHNVHCPNCLYSDGEQPHDFIGTGKTRICGCGAMMVDYIDAEGAAQGPAFCLPAAAKMDDAGVSEGWFAIAEDMQFDDSVEITGDVNLILSDGATLTAKAGIDGDPGTLTLWAQSAGDGMGALAVGGSSLIGVNLNGLTINGGRVAASGSFCGIAVDGDSGDATMTVNGGSVTANGAIYSILVNNDSGDATLTVNGGSVTAIGDCGIEITSKTGDASMTVTGGVVTAIGSSQGEGILCGTITLDWDDSNGVPALPEITATSYSGTVKLVKGFQVKGGTPAFAPTDSADNAALAGKTLVPAPSYTVTVVGGTADVSKAYQGDTVTITADDAEYGDAFVEWTPKGTDIDYARTDAFSTTFAMPARDVTVTAVYKEIFLPAIADQTYTGEEIMPGFDQPGVKLDGVDKTYQEGVDYAVAYTGNIDVGTATVTLTFKDPVTGEPDARLGTRSTTFKILPADISTATVDVADQVYNGAAQTPAVTVTWRGQVLTADDYTLDYTNNVNVGQATVTVTGKGNFDENISATGTFMINKAPLTITANDQEYVYNGQIQGEGDTAYENPAEIAEKVTVSGLQGSDALTSIVLDGQATDVGTYDETIVPGNAAIGEATGNYEITYVPGTLTIKPAAVTVTADAKRKTYGDPDPALTATVEGLMNGDGASAIRYTLKRVAGENVGEYTITPTGAATQGNYAVTYKTGKLTIVKRPLTVKADAKTKVEGTADPTLTYKATGLVNGDALTGALTRDPGEAPGTYAIKRGTLAASGNYTMTFTGATLTITPKPLPPTDPDYTLLPKMASTGKTSLSLSWNKVDGADGYDIFFVTCGNNHVFRLIASVGASARSYTITGLKKNTAYKAYVKAWKRQGSAKIYIGQASPTMHAITGDIKGKLTNAKTVTLNLANLTLAKGRSRVLHAKIKGVKSGKKILQHEKPIRWYSSDRKVATVSASGRIKAVGSGTCTIYAVANNGVRASATVKVIGEPTGVAFKKASYSLKKGKKLNLAKQVKLSPSGITSALTWSSSNPAIATVSSKGVVKGLKKGTVTITVTTANGKTATTKVTVK